MNKVRDHITVFEHETLRFDKGEKRISKDQFIALQKYHGDGVPFFSLCYNGVTFKDYVGVIQVGNTLIEVLPKADKEEAGENKWRDVLIGILKVVHKFNIQSTSTSSLKIKPNTILDLYFELFIKEVEYILHNGLSKQYRKKEGNVLALKGNLQFGIHIQKNLIHKERFFVRHTTFDFEHKLHFILYKTLRVIKKINTNAELHSRIAALLLHFPEMPDITVTSSTFDNIILNRKTQTYERALEISRMLLLKYHPDIFKGKNNVLALMFDMNQLWEQFVFQSLKKEMNGDVIVEKQQSRYFWKPEGRKRRSIQPDIYIIAGNNTYVLDTKWKAIRNKPAIEDIRQMYAYNQYFRANKVALVFPGSFDDSPGDFIDIDNQRKVSGYKCGLMFIKPNYNIRDWQKEISQKITEWIA